MLDLAQRDIKFLMGVGPARAKLLNNELKVFTLRDLLLYFPYKYIDRSRLYYIHEIDGTMPYIQIKGKILSFEEIGIGRKRRLVAHFTDGTGVIDLVWFQGIKFILSKYKPNIHYVVFGKPAIFGGRYTITHPDIDIANEVDFSAMGLKPYYNTTEKMKKAGLNSRALNKLMGNLFKMIEEPLPETLPDWLLRRERLLSFNEAIHGIHYPRTANELKKAQFRLKYEELFYIQLGILKYSSDRNKRYKGFVFSKVGDKFNDFYHKNLPFALTESQKRVVREIRIDTRSGRQMNRLLQGDVGSGKTIVALLGMLLAIDNGFQTCIMAPTEILSEQHLASLNRYLKGLDIRVELLTGSIKGSRREEILTGLKNGDVKILVSTHAVLENNVIFSRLGFVVIDEQHRFGVEQRAKLWNKNVNPPHILVMTATPIPRTLAMTLYGDLDISVIDELPPGRKQIKTMHFYQGDGGKLVNFIDGQIKLGRQVYIVYPLIQESEKIDLKNLEDGYINILELFPQYSVSKIHGKMRPAEKEAEMDKFVKNQTHILVATTVIEVGVDVPNASVMVIENAERFGLSQLHQLRGRVGRGSDQSYCLLVTGYKLSDDTRKRIDLMVNTTDGFEIAEADLKMRGPGDMEGTQQSGIPFELRLSDLAHDAQLIQHVREVAGEIINNDKDLSKPENMLFSRQLRKLRKSPFDWSAIS